MSFDWKFVNLCAHYRHESIRQFYFELEGDYSGKSKLNKETVWVPMRMSLPGRVVHQGESTELPELLEIFEAHYWGIKGIYPELLTKGTQIDVTIPMLGNPVQMTGTISGAMRVIHQFFFKLDFTKTPQYNEYIQLVRVIHREESTKYFQMSGHERRRFFRLPYVLQISYEVQKEDSWVPGSQPMICFNLSTGGLGIETLEPLTMNQSLIVTFKIYEKSFTLPAQVVWKENMEGDLPQYGLEFTKISENIQNNLMLAIMGEQKRQKEERERQYKDTFKAIRAAY